MKHTLTSDQATRIGDLLNLDGDDVRTSYIGRGMYGSTCLGFVVDRVEVVAVGVAIATILMEDADEGGEAFALEDALEIARVAGIDSMGLGSIVYFPGITVED